MEQATTTAAFEQIKATSIPIKVVGTSGRLVQWLKKPGDRVEKYEPIAMLEDDGVETEITADVRGVVKVLMFHPGTEVATGTIIGYVKPAAPTIISTALGTNDTRITPPRPAPPLKPPLAPTEPTTNPPDDNPTSVVPESLVPTLASSALTQRDNLTVIEELVLPTAPAPPPIAEVAPRRSPQSAKTKQRKTTHKTYHVEESQVQRVKRLALELQLDDQAPLDCNESELIRAAIEMLLALPRPALQATLSVNRDREKAGRYGSGWPRPGKQ